uniref:RRM domain-containing protein n=1 Tax=Ditylenchus dipsaci TaxID=166011 RepID=A0A915DDQ3_9BILA
MKMKPTDLKALHPDILSVRVVGANAWLIFPTEAACEKAHGAITSKKFEGKPMAVDCGSKSKNKEKAVSTASDAKSVRPVDPLQIVVAGLPKSATKEQLHVIFPNAKSINVLTKFKAESAMGFVKFDLEQQAQEAFDKGASLKIKGAPVDLYFARVLVPKEKSKKPKTETPKKTEDKKATTPSAAKQQKQQPQKKQVEQESDEDDDDDDDDEDMDDDSDIESSEEGLEEGGSDDDD